MRRFLYLLLLVIFPFFAAMAYDDCVLYKTQPIVKITVPTWSKTVVQTEKPMNLMHGNVIATLTDKYDIVADITNTDGGICVGIKSIDAVIGYTDFTVQIDGRHKKNSCTYNAILTHEDEHIAAYLAIIDEYSGELQKSVFSAANSIMPIFVKSQSDINSAIDELNNSIQSHPDVVLTKYKIHAAQEIKNKRIDQNDTGERLKQCK